MNEKLFSQKYLVDKIIRHKLWWNVICKTCCTKAFTIKEKIEEKERDKEIEVWCEMKRDWGKNIV